MQITLCDFCGRDIAPGPFGVLEFRTMSDDRNSHTVDATVTLCETCIFVGRKPEKPIEFRARIESEIKGPDVAAAAKKVRLVPARK